MAAGGISPETRRKRFPGFRYQMRKEAESHAVV